MSDQLFAETATYMKHNKHEIIFLRWRGFEPAIPAIKRLQTYALDQCFSTAGPRPGTGPWHQLYWAARGSPGICHFSFLSKFHENMFYSGNILTKVETHCLRPHDHTVRHQLFIKARQYAIENCALLGHYAASNGEQFSATLRRKPQLTHNMEMLLCRFLPGHPEKHCFVWRFPSSSFW